MRMTHLALDGHVAVVTGAAAGLGAVIALRLGTLGASLALIDVNKTRLQEFQTTLELKDIRFVAFECDVSEVRAVSKVGTKISSAFGKMTILVNNAGILAAPTLLEDVTLEAWDRTMAVNLRGVLICTQVFGRSMLQHGSGSIVNIASIAASSPTASPQYSVSKAAILALTRHTAVEWGHRGIRANAVSPGFIRTELTESQYHDQDLLARRMDMIPAKRLGTPDDIASAVAFLVSDQSNYINGQEIIVDGGFLQSTLRSVRAK